MDKDTIPVLVLVLIVFIVGFFFISSQTNKGRKAEITNEATESYSTDSATTEQQNQNMGNSNKGSTNTTKSGMSAPPAMEIDENKKYTAVINTTAGTIKVELNALQTPNTVNNFVALARKGFYNDTIFHRVIDGFMIQGGDPEGTGAGGPGYRFDDEPFEGEYTRGTIAMANAGPDTNGSQFFIMHKDYALPPNYTIFGKTVEGVETIDAIATAQTTTSMGGEKSKPVNPVSVTSIEIVEE